jgi:hypothetical protein
MNLIFEYGDFTYLFFFEYAVLNKEEEIKRSEDAEKNSLRLAMDYHVFFLICLEL